MLYLEDSEQCHYVINVRDINDIGFMEDDIAYICMLNTSRTGHIAQLVLRRKAIKTNVWKFMAIGYNDVLCYVFERLMSLISQLNFIHFFKLTQCSCLKDIIDAHHVIITQLHRNTYILCYQPEKTVHDHPDSRGVL